MDVPTMHEPSTLISHHRHRRPEVIKTCPMLTNPDKKEIIDAYGEEVHLFLHCHLRGYDKTGEGMEFTSRYYDKYGSPVNRHDSWTEGYRDVEKEIAKHFDISTNPNNELPLIAGYGGGVHLYKPIPFHDVEPWNVTGWVPLESKWCCEDKYFRNRYFIALRGNEIQNNLWDYHPYKPNEGIKPKKVTLKESVVDPAADELDEFDSAQQPVDKYRGGYWYDKEVEDVRVRGRYLHIIALKGFNKDDNGCYKRYNYIVHPLAYRDYMDVIPDNSVDAMQWCITNIVNENYFKEEERMKKWGDRCHGVELFNDFTYFFSWQPIPDKEHPEKEIFNGTFMYKDEPNKCYRYWFKTYPLEFGEFLLDSALTMGTYLHPIAANDAFYNRDLVPTDSVKLDKETLLKIEGMERILLSDPKGSLTKRRPIIINQSFSECSQYLRVRASKSESDPRMAESTKFRKGKPYGEDTVFGYTALIDTKMALHKVKSANPPDNVIDYHDPETDYKSGLNMIEPMVIDMLCEGQFFSHTGVYDIFQYPDKESEGAQIIPFLIENQLDATKLSSTLTGLVFTFAQAKNEVLNKDLVWRYTIQIVTCNTPRAVETKHGYFKLSSVKKTRLDLQNRYSKEDVSWIRFTAFNACNPQRRAWFPAVRGLAFPKSADKVVDIEHPTMKHTIVTTCVEKTDDDHVTVLEKEVIFTPTEINSGKLDLWFNNCSEDGEGYIYAYFFQAYPIEQVQNHLTQHSGKYAPRITESVHGYFQLCSSVPSRLNMQLSWDPNSLDGGKVFIYAIDKTDAQPIPLPDKLCVSDGLPEEYQ